MTDLAWLAVTMAWCVVYVLALWTLRQGDWSNCYLVTLRLWARHGGYVIVHRSQYGWWPHLLWSRDLRTVVEWVPRARKRRRMWPPLLYRGRLRVRRLR